MAEEPVSGEATDVDNIDTVLMQRKGARSIGKKLLRRGWLDI
jgi:hypothetical protein